MSTEHRAVFISDIHLLSYDCSAQKLNEFLSNNTARFYYLVGDIIDGWCVSPPSLDSLFSSGREKGFYCPSEQADVIKKLLEFTENYAQTRYVVGNHDEFLKKFLGSRVGNILFEDESTYTSLKSKNFLVIHGHQFDGIIRHGKWFAHLLHYSYNLILGLSKIFGSLSSSLGFKNKWSLAEYLLVHFYRTADVEKELIAYAKERGFSGIICGHTHAPSLRVEDDGFVYANCGDWVMSNTAIIETADGEFKLVGPGVV